MEIDALLNLFNSLNKEEEKAFWSVVEDLPDSIYSADKKNAQIVESCHTSDSDNKLFAELLTLTQYHNVFLRILKEIQGNKHLEECVKELKAFYNNPANEKAWKRANNTES